MDDKGTDLGKIMIDQFRNERGLARIEQLFRFSRHRHGSDIALKAPGIPAIAKYPIRVKRHMTYFTGASGGPSEQLPIDDESSPDSGPDRDANEVLNGALSLHDVSGPGRHI